MNVIPLRALLSVAGLLLLGGTSSAFMTDCARPIMLGEVKMEDATLEEAVACIKASAAKIEGFESNHINIVLLGAGPDPAKRVSLDLTEVPLKLVLEEVARAFGLRMRIESHAVVLAPPGTAEPIHTRTYRVPPDFIATGSAAK